jgi:hypothetical protein
MDTVAYVTAKFRLPYMGWDEDEKEVWGTFEDMVKEMIQEEGLFGCADDEFEILDIEQVEEPDDRD